SNLMLSDHSDLTVIEADEYDRSFHYLSPYFAVVTSADPDHLDIYGTAESYRESFEKFTSLIRPGGLLLIKRGIAVTPRLQDGVRLATYSLTDFASDYYAANIRVGNGEIYFDFCSPSGCILDIQSGVPVRINVENAVAAIAIAQLCGVEEDEIRQAMPTFGGAERRFDFQIKTDKVVYIDDYAHHPQELESSIRSVRELYAGRRLTGVFQPHLYSRTRDFADGFARALSLLDRLILLDIYPAREEPVPGITSELILAKATLADKTLCRKDELLSLLDGEDIDVLMTLGAGDIDRFVEPVRNLLNSKLAPSC
ncbi:MAG: UDP-N-acetylmuramate--L-alanine ligase, partial [Tannerella sp.]|nr:UDP-N-acetylmuramate--L-alanine ligase [Tannerella sp.]